jgi:hypothetical protein
LFFSEKKFFVSSLFLSLLLCYVITNQTLIRLCLKSTVNFWNPACLLEQSYQIGRLFIFGDSHYIKWLK